MRRTERGFTFAQFLVRASILFALLLFPAWLLKEYDVVRGVDWFFHLVQITAGTYFLGTFIMAVYEEVPALKHYRCTKCAAETTVPRRKLSLLERIVFGLFALLIAAFVVLVVAMIVASV